MATVELIDFTGAGRADEKWHAADMLIFTKSTRLSMTPGLLNQIKGWPEEAKLAELDYMAKTIPSSWEFVDFTFLITNVTRAVAQQVTRTRNASYAMQSQRVTKMSGVTYSLGGAEGGPNEAFIRLAYESALHNYELAVESGVALEDARGILPINVHCNLVAKYNLRTLSELVLKRKSLRAQGEYVDIATQMEQRVVEALPWAEPFFEPKNSKAVRMVEEIAARMPEPIKRDLAKVADLIKLGE